MKNGTLVCDSLLSLESIELTGVITNRLLCNGMNPSLKKDKEYLDKLFDSLCLDEDAMAGLEAMKDFLPNVPGEIFDRYQAIKKEIESIEGLENLIIGACGLSPLGLIFAENKELRVYDTDLKNIVSYRKGLKLGGSNYHLGQLDLLDRRQMQAFASSLCKGKTALVVEGLTFYLNDAQREKLHNNFKTLSEHLGWDVDFVFDYFVSDRSARERDTVKDENNERWRNFAKLAGNVHDEQQCFFKTRNQVIGYLRKEGFIDMRASSYSGKDNAHTIFVGRF